MVLAGLADAGLPLPARLVQGHAPEPAAVLDHRLQPQGRFPSVDQASGWSGWGIAALPNFAPPAERGHIHRVMQRQSWRCDTEIAGRTDKGLAAPQEKAAVQHERPELPGHGSWSGHRGRGAGRAWAGKRAAAHRLPPGAAQARCVPCMPHEEWLSVQAPTRDASDDGLAALQSLGSPKGSTG